MGLQVRQAIAAAAASPRHTWTMAARGASPSTIAAAAPCPNALQVCLGHLLQALPLAYSFACLKKPVALCGLEIELLQVAVVWAALGTALSHTASFV